MDKAASTLQLRDIHLPQPPGYWPLAPGWWVIIVLLLIVMVLLLRWYRAIRKKQNSLVLVQNELSDIRQNYEVHKNKHQLAVEISVLLKRFVRHILNDSSAVSLTGINWKNYLNDRAGKKMFDRYVRELNQAPYETNVEFDVPAYMAVIKNFFPAAIKNIKSYQKAHTGETDV